MVVDEFAGDVAREIDRLVIRGHEVVAEMDDKPEAYARLKAHPQLLSTAAVVLLRRPLTRDDVKLILAYTPPAIIDALVDNNVAEEVVRETSDVLSLTDAGRAIAEAVVEMQETAVEWLWQVAAAPLAGVDELTAEVVDRAAGLAPPTVPAMFPLFADVGHRPTTAGRVLRQITALRYWRADAHRAVLHDAGLGPAEAHALNRLWDAHRSVTRVGQGHPAPGSRGVVALEGRGDAKDGAITPQGLELRARIERDTDLRTAPLYDGLDDDSRDRLRRSLFALPAETSP